MKSWLYLKLTFPFNLWISEYLRKFQNRNHNLLAKMFSYASGVCISQAAFKWQVQYPLPNNLRNGPLCCSLHASALVVLWWLKRNPEWVSEPGVVQNYSLVCLIGSLQRLQIKQGTWQISQKQDCCFKTFTGAEGLQRKKTYSESTWFVQGHAMALWQMQAGRNPLNQVMETCAVHTLLPGREISLPLKIKFSAHVISMPHLLRIFLSENNVRANRRTD